MSDLLKGRYELLSKLGSGGFSTVFKANDTLLDREVAIKILKASLHEDQELVERFLLEAKLTSKLSHPNTLTVHDFGRDEEGHCFLVTELLVGQSLHERLYQARITAREAIEVTSQVALGLHEAHSKDVIHRDIKPGNIFLMRSHDPSRPLVKLLDFGIAKSIGIEGHTVTGQMMGTPTYMSPEQIVNIKEVDHRTDLYSLGVVFFHMLCGAPPFKGESYWDTMRMHMQDRLPPLSLAPQIPSLSQPIINSLAQLLNRMMAKEKSKRPSSAEEVYQQLSVIAQVIKREAEVGYQRPQIQPPTSVKRPIRTERAAVEMQSTQEAQSQTLGDDALGFLREELDQEIALNAGGHQRYEADVKRTISGSPTDLVHELQVGPSSIPIDPFSVQQALAPSPPKAPQLLQPVDEQATSIDLKVDRDALTPYQKAGSIRSLRVLILDPNEFAGRVYQRGLTQGSERRAQQLKSQGIKETDLLSVSLSKNEQELFEDLDWGANLILLDLKARDGAREREGLALLKTLDQRRPPDCHIIAICKDRELSVDAIDAGADAVLVKPVRNQELFNAASVYLWRD